MANKARHAFGSSAEVQKAHNRGDIQHIYHRSEDTENEYLAVFGLCELSVLLVELLLFSLLTVEYLNDLHTRKVFRKEGIYIGGAVLYLSVSFS